MQHHRDLVIVQEIAWARKGGKNLRLAHPKLLTSKGHHQQALNAFMSIEEIVHLTSLHVPVVQLEGHRPPKPELARVIAGSNPAGNT